MKILVTGGAGFIGSNLIKKLLDLNYKIICIDNFSSYYDENIKEKNILPFKKNKNFSLYRQDIRDNSSLKKIFKEEKPKKVCHLAAQVGVRASITNPSLYIETNVQGTLNLLNLSVAGGVENFIFASSSSVYGNNKKAPFSEDDNTDNPISPYAATKKTCEILIRTYQQLYNLNSTILRFFTVYGPSGRPDMAPFLFVDSIFRGKPIKKFGKGLSARDYTYIDDVTDGIISALERNFSYEIINLGNNRPVQLNYFISLVEQILGKKAIIETYNKQVGDVEITYADTSKAQKLLGYNPKTSIEKGMRNFIEWYSKGRQKEISRC